MKIQLFSDVHMEMHGFFQVEKSEADVIVLAGDIGVGTKGMQWATDEAEHHGKPVVYVAGNHEFYRHQYQSLLAELREMASTCPGVQFLERDEVLIDDVRFMGATLWTDYRVDGKRSRESNMAQLGVSLNDHRLIKYEDRWFEPEDALAIHTETVAWLENRLTEPFDGKTVVVTHHGPSLKCAHPDYGLNQLSAGFISDCDHLVEKADVWCFGHTHSGLDTQVGQCRLVSNQRGYPREMQPVPFQHNFIIDV